jgi:hypothetical protein
MDFTDLLHRCRNPKCRSKLPTPIDNPHKAFCTRGCHSSFYLKRCLVCENEKPSGRSARKFCRRPRCRTEYHKNRDLFAGFSANPLPSIVRPTVSPRSAQSTGIKSAHQDARPWRIVAGPVITANVYHCAAVGGDDVKQTAHKGNADRRPIIESQDCAPSDWKPYLPSDYLTLPDLTIPTFLWRNAAQEIAA